MDTRTITNVIFTWKWINEYLKPAEPAPKALEEQEVRWRPHRTGETAVDNSGTNQIEVTQRGRSHPAEGNTDNG